MRRVLRKTAYVTSNADLLGDKLYQKRACKALPILVRQAEAKRPITYQDLAEELGMPNPRNLNYVLGTIGNTLHTASDLIGVVLPPIQVLVVNKTTRLPGAGFADFCDDTDAYKNADSKGKRKIVDSLQALVFDCSEWRAVLKCFRLDPCLSPLQSIMTTSVKTRQGESDEHKLLKEYIASNPHVLKLPQTYGPGETEFVFGSGDTVDVLFRRGRECVAVEVKSQKSDVADIARGIYQCVKYLSLLKAMLIVTQRPMNCRVLLVLEGNLPKQLVYLRNVLGVEVRTGISPSTCLCSDRRNTQCEA